MKFFVSEKHVSEQRRKSLWIALFFLLVSVGLVAMLINAQKLTDIFVPAIGAFFIFQLFWATFKRLKEGAASYPIVDLDESAGNLVVNYKDVSVSLPLNQLTDLRLQSKSGKLRSVLTRTDAIEIVRFEGYENLDLLAQTLKKYVLPEKVKSASFFHK